MKKALVILVVLALASPLYAVVFTADTSVGGEVTLTWDSSGDGEGVVGMAIDVNSSAAIDGYAVDSFFDIYMDAAHDIEEGAPGTYNYGDGTPIANISAVGEASLSASFCISMGGLGGESEPLDPVPTSGTIVLECAAGGSITISENALRGGIVGENGTDLAMTGDLVIGPPFPPDDCMEESGIDFSDPVRYAAFLEAGSPECWCETRQCHGDAYDELEGGSKSGYYAIGGFDLDILLAGWGILEATFGPGIAGVIEPRSGELAACANFDNDMVPDPLVPGSGTFPGGKEGGSKSGYYHVGGGDLDILLAYWGILEPTFGPGIVADCSPGNR